MMRPRAATRRVLTTSTTSTPTRRRVALGSLYLITAPAPEDRITAMSSIPQTTALSSSNGWFYDLLTKSGLSPTTAHNVVEFVIRPLGIVLVVVIAALLARYGTRIIRRVIGRL